VLLLDTSYNRDLLPGLKAGLYGASHRFRSVRESIVDYPERSDYNPRGLPERTIKEAQLIEFGPVTFPAYAGASAGMRSITDEIIFGDLARDQDRLLQLVEAVTTRHDATPVRDAEPEVKPETPETAPAEPQPEQPQPNETTSNPVPGTPVEEIPITPAVIPNNPVEDAAPREQRAGHQPTRSSGRRDSRPLYGAPRKEQAWRL
jgi:hypothetical protein